MAENPIDWVIWDGEIPLLPVPPYATLLDVAIATGDAIQRRGVIEIEQYGVTLRIDYRNKECAVKVGPHDSWAKWWSPSHPTMRVCDHHRHQYETAADDGTRITDWAMSRG